MKFFLLPLCYTILSKFSLYTQQQKQQQQQQSIEPKLCINCNFCIKKNNLTPDYLAKCNLFPYIENKKKVLVNKNIEYYYCSTARIVERMCGKEGKRYKEKIKN